MRFLFTCAIIFRLPEVPPDTAETNVVMRTEQLPQFSEITPRKCVAACAKLAIEYETKLERHIDSLKGKMYRLLTKIWKWNFCFCCLNHVMIYYRISQTKSHTFTFRNYQLDTDRTHQVKQLSQWKTWNEILFNIFYYPLLNFACKMNSSQYSLWWLASWQEYAIYFSRWIPWPEPSRFLSCGFFYRE